MLYSMEEGSDARKHISKFFDAVDKLQDMQVEIYPDVLATMFLTVYRRISTISDA